jgi:Protein of unknown function (DUF669)
VRFQPKTENQVASTNLWPAGEYYFEVKNAEEGESKGGNEMTKLTLHVVNDEGAYRTVFDYLVATDGSAYKIRHFAEATGLLASYEKGVLETDEMIGCTGRCKLGIQKDKTGQYGDRNSVIDYVKTSGVGVTQARAAMQQRIKAPAGDIDDEIPF